MFSKINVKKKEKIEDSNLKKKTKQWRKKKHLVRKRQKFIDRNVLACKGLAAKIFPAALIPHIIVPSVFNTTSRCMSGELKLHNPSNMHEHKSLFTHILPHVLGPGIAEVLSSKTRSCSIDETVQDAFWVFFSWNHCWQMLHALTGTSNSSEMAQCWWSSAGCSAPTAWTVWTAPMWCRGSWHFKHCKNNSQWASSLSCPSFFVTPQLVVGWLYFIAIVTVWPLDWFYWF